MNFGHIAKLRQTVCSQDFVSRGAAEPGKAAAGNFKCQQALIAVGDEAFGLGVHFWCQLLGPLHVIEGQHIRIRARRGLLEATAWHAQKAIHSFDDLAQWTWIEPDNNLADFWD